MECLVAGCNNPRHYNGNSSFCEEHLKQWWESQEYKEYIDKRDPTFVTAWAKQFSGEQPVVLNRDLAKDPVVLTLNDDATFEIIKNLITLEKPDIVKCSASLWLDLCKIYEVLRASEDEKRELLLTIRNQITEELP